MQVRKKIPYPKILLITTVIIALVYTIFWFKAASLMEGYIQDWVSEQREQGLKIEHGTIKTHGFPFFLRATIDTPSFRNPGPRPHPPIWQWKSEFLDIDILPYDFSKIVFSPRGAQTLFLSQAEKKFQNWQGSAKQIRASLGRDKYREWFFILDINQGALSTQDQALNVAFSNLLINVGPAPQKETTLNTSLLISQLQYNQEAATTHKANLEEIQIALSATHTDQFEGEVPAAFWASQGGQINIDRFLLQETPSQFAAKGKISLDHAGYPDGEISMHVLKPNNFIKIIQNSNLLNEDQTQALTGATAIALLTGGGKIEKEFLFQNGSVQMDGQTLTDLPRVISP